MLDDFKRAAELDAMFTPDYEKALARLMPGGPPKQTVPSAEGGAVAPIVALLAKHGVQLAPSDVNFALGALAVVALFAVAAFTISRRS